MGSCNWKVQELQLQAQLAPGLRGHNRTSSPSPSSPVSPVLASHQAHQILENFLT